MSERPELKGLETYFRLMSINGAAHVLRTSADMKIVEALSKGPRNITEIASSAGLSQEPARLLLDVLVSLGVVDLSDGKYALGAVARFILGNYRDLGEKYWDYLEPFLKTGQPMMAMNAPGQSEKAYQSQAASLEWMMSPSAEAAAHSLGIGTIRKNLEIIDVGAGSAVWSLSLAMHDPGSYVTALDWPAVLEVAKAGAEKRGLSKRFQTIAGNYHEVELPTAAFDMAVVANVIHLETPDGCTSLFRKVHKALKENGEMVIIDVFPGQEKGDLARSLYALGLALRTQQGRIYPPEEVKQILSATGFKTGEMIPLDIIPFTMGMVVGQKNI